ncbi:uncharacterized protein MAM_04560 [Metarhizium album ARSEF 1941]|uniref:Uncharacterized protein n=1 Tax=Metarhizium album (strain ARSEF 1941) TaxID=1081103 RepID=A0A0B2WXE6_METAS|nr:uncharacterized protein MAM_04560 [Metarhizium album ARSEF 1941]KHN97545.1 hypothetical protein MAM_04560 [Metarhizium album ARSEF 1941]
MSDADADYRHYSRPYYAYLIQTDKGNGAGDWHRWLVAAASRDDMKTFFRGLQKYTKIRDSKITEVLPVSLAWWTFKSPDGFSVRELLKRIYRLDPAWYGNIDELNKSLGKITVTLLPDAGGRDWPMLPAQDVSTQDL